MTTTGEAAPRAVARGRVAVVAAVAVAVGLAHRALADIKESIRELEFYRRTIFVPPPGLDVEAAKAVAAEIAEARPVV